MLAGTTNLPQIWETVQEETCAPSRTLTSRRFIDVVIDVAVLQACTAMSESAWIGGVELGRSCHVWPLLRARTQQLEIRVGR